jgi:hypothetical protein
VGGSVAGWLVGAKMSMHCINSAIKELASDPHATCRVKLMFRSLLPFCMGALNALSPARSTCSQQIASACLPRHPATRSTNNVPMNHVGQNMFECVRSALS